MIQTLLCDGPRIPRFFCLNVDTNEALFHVDASALLTRFNTTKEQLEKHITYKTTVGGISAIRVSQLPAITLIAYKETSEKKKDKTKWTQSPKWNEAQLKLWQSHWQKCTRRGEAEKAVSSAKQILDNNPVMFLRRVIIIMIEDAKLMRELPAIVWLMMAGSISTKKGSSARWQLSLEQKEWLLHIVYSLACSPVADHVGHDVQCQVRDQQIVDLSHGQQALLWSLKIRALYGGMGGDVKMLYAAMRVWYARFTSSSLNERDSFLPFQPYRGIGYVGNVPPVALCNWILAAVDFHCSSVVSRLPRVMSFVGPHQVPNIYKHYYKPESCRLILSDDLWRKVLWCCASSLTTKTVQNDRKEMAIEEEEELGKLWHIYNTYKVFISKQQDMVLREIFPVATSTTMGDIEHEIWKSTPLPLVVVRLFVLPCCVV